MERCIFSSNLSVFFGTDKISAGELDPILPTQRCEQTGKTTKKCNKDNKKTRKKISVVRLKELGSINFMMRKLCANDMHLHLQTITKDEGNQFIVFSVDMTRNNCLKLQKKRLR